MIGNLKARKIRQWLRSPWVTFSILIEAILIPAICVIWLIGKASDNERAALQQAYTSVRQREGMIVREQLISKVEHLKSAIMDDQWGYSEDGKSYGVGFLTPLDAKGGKVAARVIEADSQASEYLEELKYLEQTFGSFAALEQIRFWIGEGSVDGMRLSGGRDLKALILLRAIGLSSSSIESDEFARALRDHLLQDSSRVILPDRSFLFLLQQLQRYLDPDPTLNRRIEASTLVIQFNREIDEKKLLRSDSFETQGDWIYFVRDHDVWFDSVGNFKNWLQFQMELPNSETGLPFQMLEPGSLVTEANPLEFAIDMGEPLQGWRLAGQLENGSILNPAKKKVYVYVWVGIFATLASVFFAVIGIGMVKNEITVAKLKNDLAATVSHELKTPIASVRILVDTLLQGKGTFDAKTRDYLELISAENQRLGLLVEKFLTFSRIERGAVAVDFQRVQVDALLREAEGVFRSRFTEGDYLLRTEFLAGEAGCIRIDRQIMLTAVGNLLENAYKYSSTPREIVLKSRIEAGEWVILEVEDNGEGIAAVEQKKIFRKFYQPDRRLSNHRGGVGLGLSIVAYVAKLHGAKLGLESQPGVGSKFQLLLPVYHAKDSNY